MFIYPLIINAVSRVNLSTGILLFDGFLLLMLLLVFFTVDMDTIKGFTSMRLHSYFMENTHKSIVLLSDEKTCSIKIRAVMHHICQLDDPTIYCLKEKIDTKWVYHEDTPLEIKSEYCIDQTRPFTLDDDIHGFLKIVDKKTQTENNKTEYKELSRLTLFTKRKNLKALQDWIDDKVKRYNKFQRNKTSAEQLLVTVMEDKDHELDIISVPWESTSTFDNSYVPNGAALVEKILFFQNNKPWYAEHGIPYTLGFLLHGPPGCGKTKFIKQLMNLTGRHGIDIKLNDKMDLNLLKHIIHDDRITDELIIPQDKRILVFEDIDAMGDMVKDRDLVRPAAAAPAVDPPGPSPGFKIEGSKLIPIVQEQPRVKNNNLSFLLNMIDGLNEGCGRIIIMTTNKPEVLDKALIRPGRIDHSIAFGKCSLQDIHCMIAMYNKGAVFPPETALRSELDGRYTSAEVINLLRNADSVQEIEKLFYTETDVRLPSSASEDDFTKI